MKNIHTNVDKLAAGGVLFERAFVTGPICSPARSALITGMYQTSIGAHHHRSGVGTEKIYLPPGVSHARGKQFLYDEGTHIPFVVSGPGLPQGQRRKDLIEHIDMAAMSLALAGIPLPKAMQARNSLATDYQPREATYSARDRADETVDHIRSVRTERWMKETNDHGRTPETESRYDADMAAYQGSKPNPEVARNIALLKQWAKESK